MQNREHAIQSTRREVRYDKGTNWRAQLGFIVISTDLVMEENIFRLAPEGVGTSIARLNCATECTVESLAAQIDGMAQAASTLQPGAQPDVICYACTSGSIVNGEETVMSEIKRGAPWSQPATLVTGVINAINALQAQKIVVATPYLDEINTMEYKFLVEKGFDVLDIQGLNIEDGHAMGLITPEFLKEFALSIDSPDADAIFVSCGGIRTIDVLQEIEDTAGKPVICSNQAMMWDCLRRAGIEDRIKGYGRLFDLPGVMTGSAPQLATE
ncbi:MAG: arylmalonate decarboxylase [Hyphomicrobiales bacterium]|nr:arylmalonate decarboxylase [Hyphomicrobiales bacterium]MCP5076420.1 arylmalonate decarboxylase [Paracoccaceae bacterium]